MVTNRGRVVVVNPVAGSPRWFAEVGSASLGASFAGLDGDGILDVILPGRDFFAIGLSGKDGALIWKTEDVHRENHSIVAHRRASQ